MKATNPTTPAMSSPTFTHATRCTVPRSSPLLSSSFTPFYPRSQQQFYHQHLDSVGNNEGDFQSAAQHSDDVDADQIHFSSWPHTRGSKLYDQEYYACSGVEPYEYSWFPNSGTVWDGCAWQQWGDTGEYVYAEDDTGDSPNLVSGSISYYAGSSALDQGNISDCTSIPVLFPDRGTKIPVAHAKKSAEVGLKASNSVTSSTAMPNSFYSVVMPEQASCGKKRDLSSLKESSEHADSGNGQGPDRGGSIEKAKEFTTSYFDVPYSMQVSGQTSSGVVSCSSELKLATNLAETIQALTGSSMHLKASYSSSKEQGSVNAAELKHSLSPSLNCPDTNEFKGPDHSFSTSFPNACGMHQKEEERVKKVAYLSGIDHSHPSSGPSPSLIDTQALEQMNDSKGLHQEKPSTSYGQPGSFDVCLNGRPYPLIDCIYNLSKVLLSSQSKASLNALSSSDCLTLENTICMLSHCLVLQSASDANFYEEPKYQQVAEEKLRNLSDPTKIVLQPGSLQEDASQLAHLTQDFQTENTPNFMASSSLGGDKQILPLKKHPEVSQEELVMLKGEVQKLEEQVAYERAESNVTVSMYKKLWNEAQEALKVSRSEIWKVKSELGALKQELVQLKHPGGTHTYSEIPNPDCGTSVNQGGNHEVSSCIVTNYSPHREHLSPELNGPEVLAGGFNLEKILTDEIPKVFKRSDSLLTDKATSSDHSGKKPEISADKSNSSHTSLPPRNLDHDVARRLSLLLSRQGLDLNKTCTENTVEWTLGSDADLEPSTGGQPSRSGGVLEFLTDVQGEDEAAPPINLDYLVWSETSYLVDGNKSAGCVSYNGLVNSQPIDGGTDFKGSTSQEDEIEIICFKPGIADMLKGEPEWEDVTVNMINDLSLNKNKTG